MKRKLTVIAAIAVCISILALGSLAYFTAQDNAENQITTGNLAIDVRETGDSGQVPVMPGETVVKGALVENIGNTAWIRAKVTMTCTAANGEPLSTDGITLDISETDWINSDGYYYFNSPVAADGFIIDLFNNVSFAAELGNEYQNAVLTINVDADAVQYANNGTNVMEAQGWPAE